MKDHVTIEIHGQKRTLFRLQLAINLDLTTLRSKTGLDVVLYHTQTNQVRWFSNCCSVGEIVKEIGNSFPPGADLYIISPLPEQPTL